MSDYIRSQIEARRKKVADAERQILILRAELHAYEDALAHMLGESAPAPIQAPRSKRSAFADKSAQGRSLQATSSAIVIAAVRAYPGTVNIDDAISAVTEVTGETAKRHNVRSSCWSNANAGLLERVADGVFRATAEGASRVGMRLAEANTANGSQAVESMRTEGEAGADDDVEQGPARVEQDLLTGASRPTHPLADERTTT